MFSLSPRWRKVLRDLWSSKTRTALVVLSIAIGVFAIGSVAGSREMIARGIDEGYASSNPAHATLITDELFDDDLVEAIQRMDGVADAEARRSLAVKVWNGEKWENLDLVAVPDYDDTRIGLVTPEAGSWPPKEKDLLLERQTMGWLGVKIGDTLRIKTIDDDRERTMRVVGQVHNNNTCPPFFCQRGGAMVALDAIEWLGEPREFNQVSITVAENALDKQHITVVAREVEEKIQKSGRTVTGTDIPEPGEHPIAQIVDTLVLLLGVLGLFSLLLSGFLVVNTIGALLTQQTRQIGVMKSIGARRRDIVAMYMVTVLLYGALSLFVAVPLGALGARAFADFNAGLFNFDVISYRLPPTVLGLQALTALLVPVLAALVPVFMGTRLTVREAISGYGLGKGRFGRSRIDRLLEKVRGLSRPMRLSLRNTFRRKARLLLTLTTLTLAGSMFIAVVSVRESVALTLKDVFAYYNNDVFVVANESYRDATFEQVLRVPGVTGVEGWRIDSTRRVRADEGESNTIQIFAMPAETRAFNPTLLQGRWLLPTDQNAVVINSKLLEEEPDLKVGDTLTLKIEGDEREFQIVGTVQMLLDGPTVYVNKNYYGRLTGETGTASWLAVMLDKHDRAYQVEVARELERYFEREGLDIAQVITAAENSEQAQSQFDIIIVLMLMMAVLLAVVGGLGLMGTMSINVLERTREIGVMRAIGASDGAVLRVVMAEGILVGVMSWALGALLALPISKLLSDAVGNAFVQAPFSFQFSLTAVGLWLAVVLILAALASFLPAWNASRLTVRDVLAYE
jgi:putative ABC transport system permease protein